MNLVLIACAAMLLVLELFDFEFPLSLVGIGIFVGLIGLWLNMLRRTYRPEVSKTEPGRLERMASFGISQETMKGRALVFAVWTIIWCLMIIILSMAFG